MSKTKILSAAGITALAGAALIMGSGSAKAANAYDTSLASPGFYNGSGNPSTEFTTDTESLSGGSIELGLRARYRGGPDVTPTGSPANTYTLSSGSNGGLALWNYDFSINLDSSGFHLSDFEGGLLTATLTVTDLTTPATATIDPVIHWADSATTDGSTVYQNGLGYNGVGAPGLGALTGEQNSENLGFSDSPLAGVFDPEASDSYRFTLTVSEVGVGQIASTTMDVNAVPEPATMSLLGLGLAGLAAVRRRRRA